MRISFIVPAYNEQDRLPDMMGEMLGFLRDQGVTSYEFIIVDDGSTDETYEVAMGYSKTEGSDRVRVLRLARNLGKGGAVRMGMLRARGEVLLMVDADGATSASDVERVELALREVEQDGYGVAVGSRAHMVDTNAVAKVSVQRTLLCCCLPCLTRLLCSAPGTAMR